MDTDYRLAPGTLTASALTTAYALSAFPIQTDQISNNSYPWHLLDDEGTTFPYAARYVDMGVSGQRADGFILFQWKYKYLTEGMAAYLESTFFGIYESALVTVRTRLHTGVCQTYNATLLRPNPNEHFKRGDMGLQDYLLRFTGCRVAAP